MHHFQSRAVPSVPTTIPASICWLLAAFAVCVGCKRGADAQPAAVPTAQAPVADSAAIAPQLPLAQPAAAPTSQPVAPPVAAPLAAPDPATASVPAAIATLPAPSFEPVTSARVKLGQQKNGLGVRTAKSGDLNAAVEHYRAALGANPAHLLARYNLACAYGLLGMRDEAFALLRQLQAVGTPEALHQVVKAKTDADLAALQLDPRMIALAPVQDIAELDPQATVAAFVAQLAATDPLPAGQAVDPVFGVMVEEWGDSDEKARRVSETFRSQAQFVAWLTTLKKDQEATRRGGADTHGRGAGLVADSVTKCDHGCCEVEGTMTGWATFVVQEVCTVAVSATQIRVVRIRLLRAGHV